MEKVTIDTQDEFAGPRTLRSKFTLGLFVAIGLFVSGRPSLGNGFVVGALLSVFSLFTLAVLVPWLFRPGGNPYAKMLLGVTLFMKLPIYMAGLYVATNVRGVSPVGAFVGIGLVPAALTLKAIRAQLEEAGRLPRLSDTRFHAMGNQPTIERPSAPTVTALSPVTERG